MRHARGTQETGVWAANFGSGQDVGVNGWLTWIYAYPSGWDDDEDEEVLY